MTLEPLGRFEWERCVMGCELARNTKLVALTLAVYANADGGNAHPGRRRLGAWCQMTERAVEQHLATLRDLGLIERTEKGHGNRYYRRADVYRLTVPDDLHDRVNMIPDPAISLDANDASLSSQKANDASLSSDSTDASVPDRSTDSAAIAPASDVLKAKNGILRAKNGALEGEHSFALPSMYTKHGSPPRMNRSSSVGLGAEEEGTSADRPEERHRQDQRLANWPTCECGTLLDPDGTCPYCSIVPRTPAHGSGGL